VNLVVNGEVLVADLERNLEQILSHIAKAIKQVERNREVVEGVFMDGIDISMDVPGQLSVRLHEVENVEVRSISQAQFYINVKSELLNYLPKVIRAAESISDLFYGDPDSDSWTLFSRLMDSFSYVVQTVHSIQLYLSNNEPNSALMDSLRAFAEKMETHLKEVDKSIQSQDYVMMADVIKYELGDVLNELVTILEAEAK
jgi:hypothetical protein